MRHGFFAILALTTGIVFFVSRSAEPADDTSGIVELVKLLGQVEDADFQLDLLKGILDGVRGRRDLKMPAEWPAVYARLSKSPKQEVRWRARVLALAFGDPRALASLRRVVMDGKASADDRQDALAALLEAGAKGLAPDLHKLLDDRAMRGAALRALARYDDPATPHLVLARYGSLSDREKQDAVGTLASRVVFARELIAAVEKKQVPAADITAFTARQIQALGDKPLSARLAKEWGVIRESSADKQKLIDQYKKLFTPDYLKQADLSHGRLVFAKTCMQCHALFGTGGKIGPDLTGSNRANLHYVLENVLDPSAMVGNAYQMTTVVTTGGRVISGIIQAATSSSVTVQTANERVVLSRDDVDEMVPSPVSMMPEGVVAKLEKDHLRDLIAYLASKSQVPLPAGAKVEVGE